MQYSQNASVSKSLSSSLDEVSKSTSLISVSSLSSNPSEIQTNCSSHNNHILNGLFQTIKSTYNRLADENKRSNTKDKSDRKPSLHLIIDDVSVLISLGVSENDLTVFLMACKRMVEKVGYFYPQFNF
jgi:hypothetical protein